MDYIRRKILQFVWEAIVARSFPFFQVTNECKFYAPAKYPLVYLAGMSVSHIGNSSIRYKVRFVFIRFEYYKAAYFKTVGESIQSLRKENEVHRPLTTNSSRKIV